MTCPNAFRRLPNLLWMLVPVAGLAASPLMAAEQVDYLRDIKPLLAKRCVSCHGAQKHKANLRLDTAKAALDGGNSGAVIVPGKSGESLLMQAVRGGKDVKKMPPDGPLLSAEQVALLAAWIDHGAKAPAKEIASDAAAARTNHWAFKTPVRPVEPTVKNVAWPRNSIDRFILARLEKENIAPAPETDRVTLIRRLSLDLLGLPPSVAEVDEFVNDARPDAYERLVDRLLASPHYGERWGRLWLDQARYADSNGFTIDSPRSMWKYRDWVLTALNKDMPFDRFAIEQVAGDLLPNATVDQKIATGFHRNTQINEEGGIDHEQFRVESIVDRVNTTGAVFLGLTVGCCQCHDHKFDPVSQREYYQLFAFLNNADEPNLEVPAPGQLEARARIRARIADLEKQLRQIDTITEATAEAWGEKLSHADRAKLPREIQTILAIAINGRTRKEQQKLAAAYRKAEQTRHAVAGIADPTALTTLAHARLMTAGTSLAQQIVELKQQEPRIVTAMVMRERPTPRQTNIHIQGDFTRKGVQVFPGTPAVMHALEWPAGPRLPGKEDPGRLDLARWLVDPANPLTGRVIMNRCWQAYFGVGIVETENDFGTQGTPPSHPELLDWLATEFIRQKWSLKAMHRLIVTSATYRQSSKARPELATVDARNRLLARQSRLRLDAELVRDAALTSTGLLTRTIGGPSAYPPQPEGVYRFTQIPREWKVSTGPDRYRRGMYTYFWRSAPHPGLTVFDAPDAATTCTRRNRSNTPLQALTLLNDQAYFEFAQALAGRVLKESRGDDTDRLRHAFRLCLARTPSAKEQKRLADLLEKQRAAFEKSPDDVQYFVPQTASREEAKQLAAWTMVARVLLNLDEFITRE